MKTSTLRVALALAICAFLFAGCTLNLGNLETRKINDYGVAIKIPKGWKDGRTGQNFWIAQPVGDYTGSLASICINRMPANDRNLEQALQTLKEGFAAGRPGYREISSNGVVTAGGLQGRVFVWSENLSNGRRVRYAAVIFAKDEYLYYVQFGCATGPSTTCGRASRTSLRLSR